MNTDPTEKLHIPSGLKTKIEIFDGYGKPELLGTILATVVGGILSIPILNATNSITNAILFVLFIMAGSVMLQVKDSSMNLSFMDHFHNLVHFMKCKKVYPFRYLDEWNLKAIMKGTKERGKVKRT